MTAPNGDLAAQVREARRLLAEYRTGAGRDRDWAPRLAGVLGVMLVAIEPVPADVDRDARDALKLFQALGEISAFDPGVANIARVWLSGATPTVVASYVVGMLHILPPHLNAARDVVVAAVRAREARHAAPGSDGDR